MLIRAVGARGPKRDVEIGVGDGRRELTSRQRLTDAVGLRSMARWMTAVVIPPNGPTMLAHSGWVRPRLTFPSMVPRSMALSNGCGGVIPIPSLLT